MKAYGSATVFLLIAFMQQAFSFHHPQLVKSSFKSYTKNNNLSVLQATNDNQQVTTTPEFLNRSNIASNSISTVLGGLFINSFGSIAAFAEEMDDVEISDLPPPYVPLLFSVFLLGGVGLLTNSLGDVISEGKFYIIIPLC